MKGSSKPPPANDEKSPTDEDYFAEQKDFGGSESVALEPEAHVAEALVVDDPEFFEFCQALPSILSDHDDLLCMSLESWQ
mmetsp:Transcript_10570/g.19157  ORF Transcript_10570/g.19157 Transcript_10570/m.19157 type:complete len:80 (+) Transcript_10570:855-1094(+)